MPSSTVAQQAPARNLNRGWWPMLPEWSRRVLKPVLIHWSAWNRNSPKFITKILHSSAPIRTEPPLQVPSHNPTPVPLVTPMDRYARTWFYDLSRSSFSLTRRRVSTSAASAAACAASKR
jgi:hypothetical protein